MSSTPIFSSKLDKNEEEFLSNFPIELIHRILLTDPSDFCHLTFSGDQPHNQTLFFIQHVTTYNFGNILGSTIGATNPMNNNSIQSQIERTMKKAFHDGIIESIEKDKNYNALKPLVVELHSNLKNLIPNRPDLHSSFEMPAFLNEEEGNVTFIPLLEHLIRVGGALKQLESSFQSASTDLWIQGAREVETTIKGKNRESINNIQNDFSTSVRLLLSQAEEEECEALGITVPLQISMSNYAVASTTYLHAKIEKCRTDIDNFKLSHVLAPRIHSHGISYLRIVFQKQILEKCSPSNQSLQDKLMHTKSWVQEVVTGDGISLLEGFQERTYSKEDMLQSRGLRRKAIWSNAWIRNLLFRSPRHPRQEEKNEMNPHPLTPFLLPEVFLWDLETIQKIRRSTQWSVVGSALALHASNMAGVGPRVLQIPLGQNTVVDKCREDLKNCLQGKDEVSRVASQDDFQNIIVGKVFQLAKAWNQHLSPSAQETLRNQCLTVLDGTDPVLQLFDTRMRDIFDAMVLWIPSHTDLFPPKIKSGISISTQSSTTSKKYDGFLNTARKELASKGFAFYAQDLAETALKAHSCIDLVWRIFGDHVLEPFLLEAFRK